MKILKIFSAITLSLLILGIYALTLKGVRGNPSPVDFKNNLDQTTMPLELSPERGRFALTLSLVENHSFSITQSLAEAVYPDVGYYAGRFYIFFAPGISLMAAPLYLLGKYFGYSQLFSFYTASIFGLLNALIIYQISRKTFNLPAWAGLFGSLTFTFGSFAWAYAVTLYQHQATTFFILSGFYCVWKYKQKTKFSWLAGLWVWTAAGLAVGIDYPNALFMLPDLIYFFFSSFTMKSLKSQVRFSFRPTILFTSLPFLFLVGIHGYYNYTQFGSPFKLSSSLVGIKTIYQNRDLPQAQQQAIIQEEASYKSPEKFFSEEKVPMSFTILTVSPDRGLVLYAPIYLLGLAGVVLALTKRRNWETSTLIAGMMTIVFLYSSWGDPWGGWAFGPRYLIPVLGIMSVFLAYFLANFRHFLIRLLALVLFAYSSAVSLIGVLTTNAVPPRVEAIPLHTGYNFLFNWMFFQDSRSSSFIYNNFFKIHYSLMQYASVIYVIVILFAIGFLFILPLFTKKHAA